MLYKFVKLVDMYNSIVQNEYNETNNKQGTETMKFKQYTNPDGGKQLFQYTDLIALADSFEFTPRQVVLGSDGHLYQTFLHIPNEGQFVYAVSLYAIDGDLRAIINPDFKVYAFDAQNQAAA